MAAEEESELARTWLERGRAILHLYPESYQRRQLYKTSLPPRSGGMLLARAQDIMRALQAGRDYASLDTEARFTFVRDIIARLSEIPAFRISTKFGRKRKPFENWEELLRWWLCKKTLKKQPSPSELGTWFSYVSDNFVYRGNWGLGAIIGILLDRGDSDGPVDALTIDDWPRSGLPWIAFWLKELLNWGTLDPVAAFLLARGNALNRQQAEEAALDYYYSLDVHIDADDMLDPRRIRDWVQRRSRTPERFEAIADVVLSTALERPPDAYLLRTLTVFPIVTDSAIRWIDPAGYLVATSAVTAEWPAEPSHFEFELSVESKIITGKPYRPFRRVMR